MDALEIPLFYCLISPQTTCKAMTLVICALCVANGSLAQLVELKGRGFESRRSLEI